MIRPTEGFDLTSLGTFGLLALGLVYGLKHATEVDHIVAVSTIVSEHRKLSHAALVGALWGVGHTASLIIVGAIVLVLRTAISDQLAGWLEFGVAFMIIGLGSTALFKALVARSALHIHTHAHDGVSHVHLHFHEQGSAHEGTVVTHSHARVPDWPEADTGWNDARLGRFGGVDIARADANSIVRIRPALSCHFRHWIDRWNDDDVGVGGFTFCPELQETDRISLCSPARRWRIQHHVWPLVRLCHRRGQRLANYF